MHPIVDSQLARVGRLLETQLHDLERRLGRLLRVFEAAPGWVQILWAFAILACLGAVFAYVWYMTFGHVVIAAVVIELAWMLLQPWRWGFVSFLLVAGSIWMFLADNALVAAAVTIVSLALAGMLTLPEPAPTGIGPRADEPPGGQA